MNSLKNTPIITTTSLVFILALGGCTSPSFVDTDQTTFFKPYQEAFENVAGKESPNQQMIHLGLPDTNKIVLWYILDSMSTPNDTLTVSVNNNICPPDHIVHYTNSIHKTGRIEINGLDPDTRYKISVSGAGLAERILQASTASKNGKAFSFLFGSCFQPYDYSEADTTFINKGAQASMLNLRNRAATTDRGGPTFFLGLGDQFYVDPGADKIITRKISYLTGFKSQKIMGHFDESPSYLRELYRFHFGLPAMDETYSTIPTAMMWDDHDIRDGWGSQGDEYKWREYYYHARDAFVAFQGARNPNFSAIINAKGWIEERPTTNVPDDDNNQKRQEEEMYFSFDRGLATFFVADGRSAKTDGPILIGKQFDDIKEWLGAPEKNEPKVFIFCFPVPVAANIGKIFKLGQDVPTSGKDDAKDRIDPKDRKKLLELFIPHFRDNEKHLLIILSGDVHYSSLQSIRIDESSESGKDGRVIGYEIISSGIAQTKYNTGGGLWGTVSGALSGLDPKIQNSVWVQDHGMYSGPCFTELFIAPPYGNSPTPKVSLEFYPASFDNKNYVLDTKWQESRHPLMINCYPENKPTKAKLTWSTIPAFLFGNEVTDNKLPDFLKDRWLFNQNNKEFPKSK